MSRNVKRLSAEDWERAALEAIAEGGLGAVAVEPLARRLGVTKGSFYAHFADRDELIGAALARWEQIHIEAFETSLAANRTAADQLRGLIELAVGAAGRPTIQGRLLLESDDPRVKLALQRITRVRLERLQALFASLGSSRTAARRRATIGYAAYIGLLHLQREAPELLDQPAALSKQLTEMLTGDLAG